MIIPTLACLVVAAPAVPTIAITHVSVIDVTRGQVAKNQNVILSGGKIAEVSSRPVPKGATVVNGTGKFLIPGLWDCHVHCWSKDLFPLFLANGVTGFRDMFGPVKPIQGWRDEIEKGTLVGPRMVAAGRIVDGPKPIWPGSVAVSTADDGRKAVETVQKEGSDFVKVYSLLPRDAYFAIAEETKKRKMPFAGHVPNSVTAREASEAGQKSFEHLYSVLQGCSSREAELAKATDWTRTQRTDALIQSFDEGKARELFQTFKKNGTWQCPTMVVLNAMANLDDPKFRDDPRKAYLSPFVTATWDPTKDFRLKALKPEDFAAMRKRFVKEQELVGAMAKAGVLFLAGTDTPNPFCFPGFSLHDELAFFVKCGMTPGQALQTATINPARYFGWEKTMGTVEKGKVADLVLLDANPLADIKNTTKIASVFMRGQYLGRAALDKMLAQKTALMPRPDVVRWGYDGD